MEQTKKHLLIYSLIFSGFLLFFINFTKFYLPLLIVSVFYLVSLIPSISKDKELPMLFKYYLSGFLILPMRLFYWDSYDFDLRLKYLFGLSTICFIFNLLKRYGAVKKFAEWFGKRELKKRVIYIFVFAEVIFIFASYMNVKKGVILVGDEPHYLVISQSIAKDGDLNVFNQYARDIYREFIDYRLQHHAKVGKGFKKWYSFHLPGLSFTIAPFFLLKIKTPLLYFLIRVYLGIFGALISVLIYLMSVKLIKLKDLSLFITLVFSFTSPVFFYSFHIFAEGQVLLLLLYSIYLGLMTEKRRKIHIFFSGFFLGITVLWGLKYLIFILIFTLLFIFIELRKKSIQNALIFSVSPIIFVIIFFAYLYFAYGNFSPMSIYTGVMSESQIADYYKGIKNISLKSRIETVLDYFFDQRDGLLMYNPFYFFFFPGLLLALKKFRKYSGALLISIAPFVYILYHGFSTVRPGFCPQARYLMPVTWIFLLFSVIYYLESENGYMKKLFFLIPVFSVFMVLFQIFNPFTLYQTTTHNYLDRSGLIFQKLSNIYIDIPKLLPSFIKLDGNASYLPNIIFTILFLALLVFSILKFKTNTPLRTGTLFFTILFVILSLFPRIPLYNPIKIRTAAGLPFLLHGNLYPKSDTMDIAEVDLGNTNRITISTVKRLKSVNFSFKNKFSSEFGRFFNFDKGYKFSSVEPSGKNDLLIMNPIYKVLKGRYYYSFRFDFYKRLEKGFIVKVEPI